MPDVVTIAQQGAAGQGLGDHEQSQSKSHITVCTSSTRPASPFEGQTIYETDTDLHRFWDGDSWERVVPLPGIAGVAELVCLVERRTVEQEIAGNSRATVLFNFVHEDPGGVYNNVTGEFTLGTGNYLVVFNTAWSASHALKQWVSVVSGTVLPSDSVCAHAAGASALVGSCSGGLTITSATAKLRARVGNSGSPPRRLSAYSYASPDPDNAVTTLAIFKYA